MSTMVTGFAAVRVTPPEVKLAVTVAVWFEVTAVVVSTPPVLIEAYAEFSLQVGVTVVVDPSLQVAVAVYDPLLLSFTDAGPAIAMLDKVAGPGGGETTGTYQEYAEASVDLSPVFSTASPVK